MNTFIHNLTNKGAPLRAGTVPTVVLRTQKSHGFTIVELLIVVVVIAVLAAIVIVSYNGMQARAIASSLQSDLSNASKLLRLYETTYGAYPTSIDPTTYCPTPADTNFCLKPSSGNKFTNYTVNNASNPPTFDLNAINTDSNTQYYASEDSAPSSSSGTFTMGAITGTQQTNTTLTAGARTPAAATVSLQWQRSTTAGGTYTNITNATNNTYAPTADRGYYVRVVATGAGTYGGTVTSAPTGLIRTPLTAIAAPTGTPTVGMTLTAGARTPSAATVSYQWRANGTNITGATASTFVLTSAQLGATISVVATATGQYIGTATSSSTAAVN